MVKTHYLYTLLLCLLPVWSQAQEVIYSWESPNGTVEETGGKIENIHKNGRDNINVACGEYHTFVLNGIYNCINLPYDTDDCSHMKITLSGGKQFREGDEIEVTAMRNNVEERPASIYFLFHMQTDTPDEMGVTEYDVPMMDTNVWNNLGKGHDFTFGTGGEKSAAKAKESAFRPSTYVFTVPKEADGAKYLRLSRYQTGNLLYVSKFVVRRKETSGINGITDNALQTTKAKPRKHVEGNRIVIESGDKVYGINGARL